LELPDSEWEAVGEICRLVEGMPLAIEMAAAWSALLWPREIAAEIRQSLDLLEADLHSVAPDRVAVGGRHRSIRAVFEHSWSLLAQRERDVFQQLTVFRGSFTGEAAQKVTGAALRELISLVSKSFLHRVSGGRLQMHSLLRRYGDEKLCASPGASEAVRDRHSAYYAGVLGDWGMDWSGLLPPKHRAEKHAERENALAALDWAVERGDVESLCRGLVGMFSYYQYTRERQLEGEAKCELAAGRLLSMICSEIPSTVPPTVSQVLANVLAWQAMFNIRLGQTERARQLLQQSLATLRGTERAGQETRVEKMCILLRMQRSLDSARDAGQLVALLLPDLDDFRTVNRTYGQDTGDIVIAGVRRALDMNIGESGILSRWHGEEWTCLLSIKSEQEAVKIADAIRQNVESALFRSTDGREVRATVSIGVAVYPRDAGDIVALHRAADRAAVLAKRMGGNRVCVHPEAMSQ
jgi:diguanylate cyclase (GGDEF)-like protein